ncbi:MAG: hypothetical protein ACREAC_22990, partial [Blastocatellia bacterium]
MRLRSADCISLLLALVSVGFVACRGSIQNQREAASIRAAEAPAVPKESPVPQPSGKMLAYNFDQFQVDSLPEVLTSTRTGKGPPMGEWRIVTDDSAPSRPNVLAQV